ncbi:MAG: SpoIIE family protein phosphatase [Bacteroidales bacterium]|nr:SpoIIE family protein phosphatase [Bacteroidales bacterium]
MKSHKKRNFKFHRGLLILLVAAIVLETNTCIQYFYSKNGIKQEAVRRAESELKRAELEITVVTTQIESALKMMVVMSEQNVDNPEIIQAITRAVVKNTPNMLGAGIAYKADYFPEYGRWYEVYSKKAVLGSKAEIETRMIGSSVHDYFQSKWYQNGLAVDHCVWSDPYYDNEGGGQMLMTCSLPIRNQRGEIVAVAGVDISLERLQHISQYLQVYKESYYSICTSDGVDIVTPPDTASGRKYLTFYEDIDATGWRMAIIIPEDIIFANLKRVGLVVTILMLAGLFLLAFIMYRAGVDIISLAKANAQKERLMGELEVARNIQMSMLPKTFLSYPNCQDLNMYGVIIPAKEVGGDLYDFYLRDNKLFFCVGDVSGKGVPASLVMATIRSLFRSISAHEQDVSSICMLMNDAMSEANEQNMFVTFFLGVMDITTGQLSYCNAGHNAPVLIGRHSSKTPPIEQLPTIPNLPLGILSGYSYIPQTTTLHRGDVLFLYTDGLTEAENSEHVLFGENRMIATLRQFEEVLNAPKAQDVAQQQIETMLNAVNEFVGEAEQSDDLTMLSIRYLPLDQLVKEEKSVPVKHSIVMRNDIAQIPTLAEWIESLDVPQSLNMTLNLALEEAVSNVMLYAYPEDKKGTVLIEAEKGDTQITFVISDSGVPFDPTRQPEADITLSAEERSIGGLGVHLVRQIMDSIAYQRKDDKNILTLIKKI